MSLRNSWIDFLHRVATGSKKVRNIMTPIGATFYAMFTALFVVVALKVDKLLDLPSLFKKPLNFFYPYLFLRLRCC